VVFTVVDSRSENCDSNLANVLSKNDIFQDLGLDDQNSSCIQMLKVIFTQEHDKKILLDPYKSLKLPLIVVQNEPIVELDTKYKLTE
jgi:hypothetical protein